MKILFLSDTHSQHRKLKNLPEADMVIHAGDVSKTGRDHEVEDFMRWFSALNYKYKVFIAGNHDFFFENETTKSIARFLNGNTFYLFNSTIEIEGLKIWGSPFTPTFFNWAFNLDRGKDIQQIWNEIPNDTDILVTHGPPLGILDRTTDQLNVGCENLLKKVKKIKTKYHLFGHIHEGYGILNTDKTTFINGSLLNEHNQLVNQPVLFEFSINIQSKRLYLDDLRPTPEGFERAYDFEEFVNYISQNGLPDFISFDHDLGEGKTGLDCAKFLVEYCLDNQIHKINFQVHSQNPVGKENIEFLLKNFNKHN